MGSVREGWDQMALEGFLTEAQTLRDLVGLSVEGWVVLQSSKFDVHANNEPHIGQTLYMEKVTGRYLHKVFGKTIQDGHLESPSGLKDLTHEIFEHSRVCQGIQDDVKVEPGIALAPGIHPYPRKVDPQCQLVFKDPQDQAIVCPECTRALESDVSSRVEEYPDLAESSNTFIGGEEKEEPLDSLSIDMDEPDTTLWPDQNPIQKMKYDESDYNSSAHEDDGNDHGTEENGNVFLSEGLDEKVLSEGEGVKNQIQDDEGGYSISSREGQDKAKGAVHCDHCNKTFSKATNYQKHRAYLRQDLRRPERKISCKDCKQDHYSFASLAKHMTQEHNKTPIALGKYLQDPREIKLMKKGRKCSTCAIPVNGNVMVHRHRALYHELGDFKCQECDQYQLTYYHLVLHNYNQHNRVSPYLEPSNDGLEQVKHEDGTIELVRKLHDCPKCGKVFKYDADWGKHMRYHHSWAVFNCQPCDELCHYAQDFVAHVKNFHPDKPEIKCPKCSETVSIKDDLNSFDVHFKECARKILVAGEKSLREKQMKKVKGTPLQCEQCGKNYHSKYLFKCHLDSHAGVERYQCDKCDYTTNAKGVMRDHRNIHLRAEGKTQDGTGSNLFFYCHQCPKKVSTKGSLNLHIKHVHEGVKRSYKCQNCETIFNHKTELYTHKRQAHGFAKNRVRRGKRDITL